MGQKDGTGPPKTVLVPTRPWESITNIKKLFTNCNNVLYIVWVITKMTVIFDQNDREVFDYNDR